MKISTFAKTFTPVVLAAFALGLAPSANADDKGCSNGTLKGSFAFTSTGVIVTPAAAAGPVAEVGTQTFDGNGKTTGTAIIGGNGNFVPLTITGTYTVNADCTGTMALQVSPFGLTVPVFFVIAQSANELQALETLQGTVISRVYKRQFPVGDWRQ